LDRLCVTEKDKTIVKSHNAALMSRLPVVSVGLFIHLNHRALVPTYQNTAGITYLQMSLLRSVHLALLSD
jgi:hypothetical protein